jgi:nucleotide-binding universal stress UspA family protein
LTAYLGVGAGALIVVFAAPRALLFLSILLVILTVAYLLSQAAAKKSTTRAVTEELRGGKRILVSASTTPTAIHLARLAARLAEHQEDTSICLFNVIKALPGTPESVLHSLEEAKRALQKDMLRAAAPYAVDRNVPIYTKLKVAPEVESGIFDELSSANPVGMVLLGWPADENLVRLPHNIIKEVLVSAHKDVAVLRDRGLDNLHEILVPVGNGPNARLALKLASDLAYEKDVSITALRLMGEDLDEEKQEDELAQLQEIIEAEMGGLPRFLTTRLEPSKNVLEGIIAETRRVEYDLMIIGAAEEVFSSRYIFGKLNDALLEEVDCSMLIVRRYQADSALWLRHQIKHLEEGG